MRVLFLRHAHAVDTFGVDDHRWLSERGREQARVLGDVLRRDMFCPEHVWTSPKVRAVQTCELVLGALGEQAKPQIAVWPDLAYGSTATALSCLEQCEEEATVLLVGHEPLIRSMAAYFGQTQFGGFSTATGAMIERKNKSILSVDLVS